MLAEQQRAAISAAQPLAGFAGAWVVGDEVHIGLVSGSSADRERIRAAGTGGSDLVFHAFRWTEPQLLEAMSLIRVLMRNTPHVRRSIGASMLRSERNCIEVTVQPAQVEEISRRVQQTLLTRGLEGAVVIRASEGGFFAY